MKILVIDNYDSFTYNLVQYLKEVSTATVEVYRNDQIELERINDYDALVLSPGPGLPSEAESLLEIIKTYAPSKPILGVCLGHQAIAEVFGAKLDNLTTVYHGVATNMQVVRKHKLFEGLGFQMTVGRYHSWSVDKSSLPNDLQIIAEDDEGQVMAIAHRTLPVVGVQFHPESVLTSNGREILKNFVRIVGFSRQHEGSQEIISMSNS